MRDIRFKSYIKTALLRPYEENDKNLVGLSWDGSTLKIGGMIEDFEVCGMSMYVSEQDFKDNYVLEPDSPIASSGDGDTKSIILYDSRNRETWEREYFRYLESENDPCNAMVSADWLIKCISDRTN